MTSKPDQRQQIVEEIKRLASANMGKPPGREKFARETGIREWAWSGIYWTKWSDVLIEAGFQPNRLQIKIDSDVVLKALSKVFRYYKKVPTSAELKMYRRIDANFPSLGALNNHFKSKEEMLNQLREWVTKNEEYADVGALLPDESPQAETGQSIATKEGSVYLIRSGAYFKIGRSDEIERRVKEIRVALPDAAELVHSIKTDDPAGIEAYWHRRFADRRANGEWFKLTPQDVAAFRRRHYQ